eukprot:Skav231027  [mRNA]  locus=scaffold1869:149039:162168:- [translate_table: standard]
MASRIYGHASGIALGQWSLNVSHWPQEVPVANLFDAVSNLAPLAVHLQVTPQTLSCPWKPKKDFDANRLVAGRLQLAPGWAIDVKLIEKKIQDSWYLSPGERAVEDKTPTPCTSKYSENLQSEIIEAPHFFQSKVPSEKPWLLLMLGGSGAGKGTFLREIEVMKKNGMDLDNFVVHGLDEYIEYLPEYKASLQNKLVVYKERFLLHEEVAGHLAVSIRKNWKWCEDWQNEETGKDLSRIVKRILPAFEEDTFQNVPENYAKLKQMKQAGFASEEQVRCRPEVTHLRLISGDVASAESRWMQCTSALRYLAEHHVEEVIADAIREASAEMLKG